jgi:hypothetical protein
MRAIQRTELFLLLSKDTRRFQFSVPLPLKKRNQCNNGDTSQYTLSLISS